MNDERTFKEKLAFRMAFRKFERAFEASDKLSEPERKLMYREIAKRILQDSAPVTAASETEADVDSEDEPPDIEHE